MHFYLPRSVKKWVVLSLMERTLCAGLSRIFPFGFEDLNLGRCSFSLFEGWLREAVEWEQKNFCLFVSNDVDTSQTVMLPLLLSFSSDLLATWVFFCELLKGKKWLACDHSICVRRRDSYSARCLFVASYDDVFRPVA